MILGCHYPLFFLPLLPCERRSLISFFAAIWEISAGRVARPLHKSSAIFAGQFLVLKGRLIHGKLRYLYLAILILEAYTQSLSFWKYSPHSSEKKFVFSAKQFL